MTPITGNQLRSALRRWELRREVVKSQYKDSLFQFKDDSNRNIEEVMNELSQIETAIAEIQAVQTQYNFNVSVDVTNFDGKSSNMTLLQAVKLLGGSVRIERMWRNAAKDNGRSNRYRRSIGGSEYAYASRTVSVDQCLSFATRSTAVTSSIRNAISQANTTELDLETFAGINLDQFVQHIDAV